MLFPAIVAFFHPFLLKSSEEFHIILLESLSVVQLYQSLSEASNSEHINKVHLKYRLPLQPFHTLRHYFVLIFSEAPHLNHQVSYSFVISIHK